MQLDNVIYLVFLSFQNHTIIYYISECINNLIKFVCIYNSTHFLDRLQTLMPHLNPPII